MSGAQPSSFLDQNILFNSAAGITGQQIQRNELLNTRAQQEIGGTEIEYAARAAQGLLGLGDEAAMAAAYPGAVASAQQYGFLKNAPPVFPGKARLEQIAAMGTSSEKQAALRSAGTAIPTPGFDGQGTAAPGATTGAAPAVPIPARGTGGPGASTAMPPEYMEHFRRASAETGIPVDLLIAQARQESSFNPNARGAAGEIGIFQIKPSTAQQPGFGLTGVDPGTLTDPGANIMFGARYLKARMGQGDPNNPADQARALAAYNGGGDPNYVANVNRYRPGQSPTDPARAVTTYTPGAPGGVGVAARTGGVDVAGPGAPPGAVAPVAAPGTAGTAQSPPAAAPAPPQPVDNNNLTRQDYADLQRARASGMTGPQLSQEVQQRQNANITRQRQYQIDVQQAQQHAQTQGNAAATQAREQERLRIAQEEAETKPDRVLARYADKIANDTATHQERQLYSLAAQHYLKPTMTWGDDPTDPSRKVMVQVPGQMPSGFPHPDFKPGQQPAAPPTATKAPDVKPLPEAERKVLLDTAGRLDQVSEQVNTFKPDYAGFTNAAVGDLANTAARNLPASKLATDRANWWSDYQRYKLAVRQGISGQSLTASEMSEFDKADINPGMTPEVVKRNLEHQASVLRTSHERRVASLAADKYSPDAIRAASGLDPAKVTSRPVGAPDASPPQKTSLPPGWTVKIP